MRSLNWNAEFSAGLPGVFGDGHRLTNHRPIREKLMVDVRRNRPHEKRRYAVPHPCPPIAVAALDDKLLGIRCQCLDLRNGQPTDLVRMNEAGRGPARALYDGRRRSLRVKPRQAEMPLALLPGQHPVYLLRRPDLGPLQLVAGIGAAHRGGRPVGGNPGVDALRPCAE